MSAEALRMLPAPSPAVSCQVVPIEPSTSLVSTSTFLNVCLLKTENISDDLFCFSWLTPATLPHANDRQSCTKRGTSTKRAEGSLAAYPAWHSDDCTFARTIQTNQIPTLTVRFRQPLSAAPLHPRLSSTPSQKTEAGTRCNWVRRRPVTSPTWSRRSDVGQKQSTWRGNAAASRHSPPQIEKATSFGVVGLVCAPHLADNEFIRHRVCDAVFHGRSWVA
jgi:hypothetical protein